MKALIVVNPFAGRGHARRILPRLKAYLRSENAHAEFTEPQNTQALWQQAREAVAAGYDRIGVLGGDGTFQQVVAATFDADVTLGIIPAGGGNDIAAGLGISREPVTATHTFLHGRARRVDVLQARFASGAAAPYVGGGGLGLDAEAARLAAGRFRRLPGAARYWASALRARASFEPLEVEVTLDGELIPTKSGPLMLAAAVNAPCYGAGVKIAPEARMDDGLLDLVLVPQVSWTRLLELLPAVFQTGDIRSPKIQRFRARRVLLKADRPAAFHGDGELLGEAPVEIENLPGAIRVITR